MIKKLVFNEKIKSSSTYTSFLFPFQTNNRKQYEYKGGKINHVYEID